MSHAWIHPTLVLSWTLLVTVTLPVCQDETCRPRRDRPARFEQTMGTFQTREACEAALHNLTGRPTPSTGQRTDTPNQQQLTGKCEPTKERQP